MSHTCDGDNKVEIICTKTLLTDLVHKIQLFSTPTLKLHKARKVCTAVAVYAK